MVEDGDRFPSRLGVMPYRRSETAPEVCYIHADLPRWDIDTLAFN
jgi:hypothetical protein